MGSFKRCPKGRAVLLGIFRVALGDKLDEGIDENGPQEFAQFKLNRESAQRILSEVFRRVCTL